jgi:rhodanese-related sulfurtransferase
MPKVKLHHIFSLIIILVIVYVVSHLYIKSNKNGPQLKIDVPEARSRRFGLIIDVRTPKERELFGYYPNSVPISIDKLNTQVPLDISNKDTHILVYSSGDNKAGYAANILYRMGYRNVRYITETYQSLMPGY